MNKRFLDKSVCSPLYAEKMSINVNLSKKYLCEFQVNRPINKIFLKISISAPLPGGKKRISANLGEKKSPIYPILSSSIHK